MSDDKGKLAQRWERAKAMTCLAFGVSTPEQAIMMGAGVQYAELFQVALDQVQSADDEAEDRANCGDMRKVIDGAVGREREACAKIADAKAEQIDSCGDDYDPVMAVAEVADAIRARGEVKLNETWSVGVTAIRGTLGASGGYPGISPSLAGKPETYPPIALTSVFPNGILVDGAGNLLSPSMAGQQAKEEMPSYRDMVGAGNVIYGIDERGIYRNAFLDDNSSPIDRAFASPVAAYLEENKLTAEDISYVAHDKEANAVCYHWPGVTLAFMLDDGKWTAPITKGILKCLMDKGRQDFEAFKRNTTTTFNLEPSVSDLYAGIPEKYRYKGVSKVNELEAWATESLHHHGNCSIFSDNECNCAFGDKVKRGEKFPPKDAVTDKEISLRVKAPLSFDANGIKHKQGECDWCGGLLSPDRVAVCKACSPDQV